MATSQWPESPQKGTAGGRSAGPGYRTTGGGDERPSSALLGGFSGLGTPRMSPAQANAARQFDLLVPRATVDRLESVIPDRVPGGIHGLHVIDPQPTEIKR